MYSLVNASTLGFDLARRQQGHRVADLLTRALRLTAGDLRTLAVVHRDDLARADAWAEVAVSDDRRIGLPQALRDVVRVIDVGELGGRGAATALERAAIGNLGALLRCVRYDVFDWTWRDDDQDDAVADGVAAVCDAVAAAYLAPDLSAAASTRLAATWTASAGRLAHRPPSLGPHEKELHLLLARLRDLDAGDVRLTAAVDRMHAGGAQWAAAMHRASWAAYLGALVRPSATAQLLAVGAVEEAGLTVADRATGAWNLVSGAVLATAVRDLVSDVVAARLTGPLLSVLDSTGA